MNLLLDTHVLLWWIDDHPALSEAARSLICSPENPVFVSAATFWEIYLKESLGKLRLPTDFEHRLCSESFEDLPVSAEHARQCGLLPWLHRDPFDRMLVAQAKVERLTLLTADKRIADYGSMVHFVG